MQHWPRMRPPAPLKARWIFPRCFVCASRISHVFSFAKIKSNQGFFTTSNIFVERRKALLLPAFFFFCPVVVLPLLPRAPLPLALPRLPRTPLPRAVVVLPLLPRTPLPLMLPLLPRTPLPRAVVVLPPNTFRFELAHDALALKHSVQNFARGEAASFLQRGLQHLLLALAFVSTMAATGELKRGRYLGRNGYGNACGTTSLTMTRFSHLIAHASNCAQYPYEYANPGKCKPCCSTVAVLSSLFSLLSSLSSLLSSLSLLSVLFCLLS